MKKQIFSILYLTLILFCSSYLCSSQVIEYSPIGSHYVGDVKRGNLHKIKGNVKSFTTSIFQYDSDTKEYTETFHIFPEKYEPSKYFLDRNGNITKRVLINDFSNYYKTFKNYKINDKKTNVCNKNWKELKTKKVSKEEIFSWDYFYDKKIVKSLFDKNGVIYERNKNNLTVYYMNYENEHLFHKDGNLINPNNNIESKELLYKFKYNNFDKVEKCESFGDPQICDYFYDNNNNLIREDIYSYSGGKFYEFQMKTYSLNDKNDVINKKIYTVYVYNNPFDENTILNKLLKTISENTKSELKYNTEEFQYKYVYDDYGNWTTKFYPSLDRKMKVIREFEYYEKK